MSKITKEVVDKIQTMRKAGRTIEEIVAETKVASSTVSRYAKGLKPKAGERPRAPRPPETPAEIRQRLEADINKDQLEDRTYMLLEFAVTQIEGACKIIRKVLAS